MQVAPQTDLKGIVLDGSVFGPQEIQQITATISADFANYRVLREAVQELEVREATPASKVRLGVCYYLLGRYRSAAETLSTADGGALAQFYLGRTRASQGQYNDAIEAYQKASKGGYDVGLATLAKVEALRQAGRHQDAMTTLDSLSGAIEQTAEYLYQRGATVAALGNNPSEVVALYERAVESDPAHAGALFGLALENDRRGNDDEALKLYERSATRFPSHIGALLNLGVLYEDGQRFDRAVQCYQRILEAHPNEPRARLYYKDARASGDMFFDEDAQKRRDRMSQVLSIPVTDFELSVRSRNCLQKMGLLTLGDLARTSEQELLASKNFGETSLVEIKEMMASKGLELGQFAHERPMPEFTFEPEVMSADEQVVLNKPISDLNLSVRARKCMIRLGVVTIGDLLRRTGDELLECKNFGVTSLTEVREKLTIQGLRLRGD